MAPRYKLLTASTMTRLGYKLVDDLLVSKKWQGHTSLVYTWPPMTLYSKSCIYTFDIGKLYLSKRRWELLINTYLNKESISLFRSRLTKMLVDNKKIHSASLVFNQLGSPTNKNKIKSHPLGSCLLALTYIYYPATMILHSRTTRVGYTSFLDLALAYKILEQVVCPTISVEPSQVQFYWQVDLPQLSSLYVLYYVVNSKWKDSLGKKVDTNIWRQMSSEYKYLLTGKAKFGPATNLCKKINRGVIKPVPIQELTLENYL